MSGKYVFGEISKLFSNKSSSNVVSGSVTSVPKTQADDGGKKRRKYLKETKVLSSSTEKNPRKKLKPEEHKKLVHEKPEDADAETFDKKYNDNEEEKLSRTLFVGNLPSSFTKKQIKSLFSKYGKLQSIRIRNAIPGKPSLTKKIAVITKNFHPERESINAYVVFKSLEKATAALELNGLSVEGNYIRVDLADNKDHNHKSSVFVGNLPFGLNDDELRSFFHDCGEIQSIRIIRDKATGAGKGFGYVAFKEESGVLLALKKHEEELANRNIRVFRAKKEKVKHANRISQPPKPNNLIGQPQTSKQQFKFLKNADWMGQKGNNSFEGVRSVENAKERVKIQKNIKTASKNAKLQMSKLGKLNVSKKKSKKQ